MRSARLWGPAAFIAALVVVVQVMGDGVFRGQRAAAIGDATRPFVLSTPLFTPKSGSNSTLTFVSFEDVSASLNLRRYNAVGGLLSSTTFTLSSKSSIIAFAGANSGAQMHVEIWAPTPNFAMELTYTDGSDAVQRIPFGDMFQPRAGIAFVPLTFPVICDTRNNSNPTPCEGSALTANATRSISVAGIAGIPTVGVRALTFVVRVENHTETGWFTFFPDGGTKPSLFHLLFRPGLAASAEVTVPVGANGKIAVYNKRGTANLVMHAAGYSI